MSSPSDPTPIRLFSTGGTFEKRYDPICGNLIFTNSQLPAMLSLARADSSINAQTLMLIDSLQMTDAHRAQILAACRDCAENRIVIVHGTDTMVETARVLGEAALNKTIVLTGAMLPHDLHESDAMFNLGFALACASTLVAGVWVAMNAVVRRWDQVRKNREKGIFESGI